MSGERGESGTVGAMDAARHIVVIDDLRCFGAFDATYARTSAQGVALLAACHAEGRPIDELWLDHDLGGTDDINPVIAWIAERCVWDDRPNIGRIVAHTSNPVGAEMINRSLRRWYPVTRVDASDYALSIIKDGR